MTEPTPLHTIHPYQPGLAECKAVDAIFLWGMSPEEDPMEFMVLSRRLQRDDEFAVSITPRDGRFPKSDGAVGSNWKKWSQPQTVVEYAFEMIFDGFDRHHVIRECCRIEEFYLLGASSLMMRRMIAKSFIGSGYEGPWPIPGMPALDEQ